MMRRAWRESLSTALCGPPQSCWVVKTRLTFTSASALARLTFRRGAKPRCAASPRRSASGCRQEATRRCCFGGSTCHSRQPAAPLHSSCSARQRRRCSRCGCTRSCEAQACCPRCRSCRLLQRPPRCQGGRETSTCRPSPRWGPQSLRCLRRRPSRSSLSHSRHLSALRCRWRALQRGCAVAMPRLLSVSSAASTSRARSQCWSLPPQRRRAWQAQWRRQRRGRSGAATLIFASTRCTASWTTATRFVPSTWTLACCGGHRPSHDGHRKQRRHRRDQGAAATRRAVRAPCRARQPASADVVPRATCPQHAPQE
mmetsp:Transcript_581/g.1930  ORF Transcript_581/g.1930 Transcript_581/m.1930 type:complete len:313 (+) Transcript_581:61-999(+)